jgi:hypothetical protein
MSRYWSSLIVIRLVLLKIRSRWFLIILLVPISDAVSFMLISTTANALPILIAVEHEVTLLQVTPILSMLIVSHSLPLLLESVRPLIHALMQDRIEPASRTAAALSTRAPNSHHKITHRFRNPTHAFSGFVQGASLSNYGVPSLVPQR